MLTTSVLRHLRVGATLGDERQHLELAGGQALRRLDVGARARRARRARPSRRAAAACLPPRRPRSGLRPGGCAPRRARGRDAREAAPAAARRSPSQIASAAPRRRTARSASPAAAARKAADSSTSPQNQRSPNSTKSVNDSSNCAAAVSASPRSASMSATFQSTLPKVRRSPTARRMSRLSSACARAATSAPGGTGDGEAVERERDAVRVAEPPEQLEAALEERPGAVVVSGDHEVHREPVERPRDPLPPRRGPRRRPGPRERASPPPGSPRASSARARAPCTPPRRPCASSSERESSSASWQSSSARS